MTKHFFTACALALVCILTGCKKEYFIEPQTTEVEGALAKAFVLEEGQYPVEISEDGTTATVTVNVKRTEVTLPFTANHVGVIADGQPTTEDILAQAGFGYAIYSTEGDEIEVVAPEKSAKSSKEQLALLQLEPGKSGKLTIKFDFDPKFVPAKIKLTSDMKLNMSGLIPMDGSIDKYTVKNFEMEFNFQAQECVGKYQYTTSPAGAFLYLDGTTGDLDTATAGEYSWPVMLSEDNGQGMVTGQFEGTLQLRRDGLDKPYYYVLTGDFVNFRYDTFLYKLKSAPITEIFK